jgi:hypothetical protein
MKPPRHLEGRDALSSDMTRTILRWALVLLAMPAMAADTRWTAVAVPPRPSLPAVTIVLGEPGYISKGNTPITLQAAASNAAFDGHIGYHFEVAGNKTVDIPVVARAVLAPHGQWSFNTWLHVDEPRWTQGKNPNRELVIEWRDRSMLLVAKKVAGTPPWSDASPLRIVRDGQAPDAACCFGVTGQVRRVADLATVAQWYTGFSRLVIATELWLDLPPPVREAAFASGIRRVFIGSPRADQTLSAIDRAVLPVEFSSTPGPSWRAKSGTRFVGTDSSPSLVDDGWNVFVADAAAVAQVLPSTNVTPIRGSGGESPYVDRRAVEVLRDELVRTIAIVVLLLTVAIAIVMTRARRGVALASSVVIAIALLACRDQLRTRSRTHVQEEWAVEGVGATSHSIDVDQYGPTPIAAHPMRSEDIRTSVTGPGFVRQDAELRTAGTAPGHGAMFISPNGQAWDFTKRWARRSEAGQPVRITILSRQHDTMTFDYEAPFPVQFARARWTWNDRSHEGDGRLGGASRGRATVHNSRYVAPLKAVRELHVPGDTEIALIAVDDNRTAVLKWKDRSAGEPAPNWTMGSWLQRDGTGVGRCSFALPRFSPDSTMSIQISEMMQMRNLRVTFGGATIPLIKDDTIVWGNRVIDAAMVKRMATEGGILAIAVEGVGDTLLSPHWVEIKVKENRHD